MNAQYSDTHLNPKSGSWMPSIQTLTVNPKSKLNWIESGSKKLKLNRIWFLQTSQMSTSRSPTRQNNPKFMVPDQPNAYHGPRPAKCLHHGPRPDRAILNSWSPTRQIYFEVNQGSRPDKMLSLPTGSIIGSFPTRQKSSAKVKLGLRLNGNQSKRP